MAVTISAYNHTTKLLLDTSVDLANLKLELLDASASFVATDTTKSAVDNSGAYEVSGNGWTAGGETLASVAVTTVTTNDAKLDAADITVTATGGDIGPAYGALLYDATSSKPLFFIDFGAAETAGVGTDFKITWNASGIYSVTI